MQQANRSQSYGGQGRPSPVQVTALALRGLGQVYDMNLAATRVLLQTQARAASAFGFPDWSGVFNQFDERARHVFSASAEQLVQTAQRANEAAADLQRQVGRVVETQAVTVAESLQHGLEELGSQTSEGLQQLCDTARQQADEAERVAQSVSQEMREALHESSEQMRSAMREGSEQMGQAIQQGGEQTRELAQRGREAATSGDGGSQPNGGQPGEAQPGPQAGAEDRAGRRGKGGGQPTA